MKIYVLNKREQFGAKYSCATAKFCGVHVSTFSMAPRICTMSWNYCSLAHYVDNSWPIHRKT